MSKEYITIKNHYKCVSDTPYEMCLPYNSDTARLIGTTNNYKEDE